MSFQPARVGHARPQIWSQARSCSRALWRTLCHVWIVCLTAQMPVSGQSLVINEVVAANWNGIPDEDGDRPDWVELYNGSTTSLNVGGYGLSDDKDLPFKWRLPSWTLPVGGYLVIYASGKDRANVPFRIHSNFSIRSSGERLFLTSPSGQRLSEVPSRNYPADMSLGCSPDGSTNWVYFPEPTPRGSNQGTTFPDLAPKPNSSFEGGFYPSPFAITLKTTSASANIHYTLDGSEPTPASPKYAGPIALRDRNKDPNVLSMIEGTSIANQHTDGWFPPAGTVPKATVLRARSFREGSLPSEVVTRTWFVGPSSPARFQLPVLSLSADTNALFDHTQGIYVLGKLFEDYIAAHPNEPLTGHTPANYQGRGSKWERPASLEFYGTNGVLAFERNVKIQIEGQSSRSFRQKSIGLRTQGEEFPAALLPGRFRRGTGEPLTRFSKARLGNSGNDWAYTLFRDPLCHVLVDDLPLDSLAYRPCVVYLDGEFWGIHNIREEQDGDWIEAHYGVPRSEVILCEGAGALLEGKSGEENAFVQLREYIRLNDLTKPAVAQSVSDRMDVANFLLYQAAEIYFGNADWPHNNIRYWRKRAVSPVEGAARGHDGRWRWLLFDVDLGYAHPWSGGYSANTLAAATDPVGPPGLNAGWSTVMLRQVLKNPEFRDQFIRLMADLMNTAFREERVAEVLDQLNAAITPAMPEHIRRWRTMGDSMTGWTNNVKAMRLFASQRPFYLRQHVANYFKLPGSATLTFDVEPRESGVIRAQSTTISPGTPGVPSASPYPWRGRYFRNVPITLEALPKPGWRFDGWTGLPLPSTSRVSLTPYDPATITARFVPLEIRIQSIAAIDGSRLRIVFHGSPNRSLALQVSSNFSMWSTVSSATANAEGLGTVEVDSGDANSPEFFRIQLP